MRRTTAAVVGTFAATALLLGARMGIGPALGPGTDVGALAPDTGDVPAGDDVPVDTAGPEASDSGTPSPTAAPETSAAAGTAPLPTTKPRPTRTKSKTPAAATTTGGTGLKNGTFKGTASRAGDYGTIQVTITVSGGRMTNVSATYPTSPSRTDAINTRAIPTLKQEALTAQSASIATVSGATYTSNAYKISLKSALNAARQ